jgi:hypothetical protein
VEKDMLGVGFGYEPLTYTGSHIGQIFCWIENQVGVSE